MPKRLPCTSRGQQGGGPQEPGAELHAASPAGWPRAERLLPRGLKARKRVFPDRGAGLQGLRGTPDCACSGPRGARLSGAGTGSRLEAGLRARSDRGLLHRVSWLHETGTCHLPSTVLSTKVQSHIVMGSWQVTLSGRGWRERCRGGGWRGGWTGVDGGGGEVEGWRVMEGVGGGWREGWSVMEGGVAGNGGEVEGWPVMEGVEGRRQANRPRASGGSGSRAWLSGRTWVGDPGKDSRAGLPGVPGPSL